MAKRVKKWASLYTETRWAKPNPDPEGHLLSEGKYRTKIYPEDLPEWYVSCHIYSMFGYLSAKGVIDLYYLPSYRHPDELYKDDCLFISYNKPIVRGSVTDEVSGYDHCLYGIAIVDFIKAAEQYSNFDVTEIREQLKRKIEWYEQNGGDYQ